MNDTYRHGAARAALADNPPLPTDGQVIREAMSRLVPIAASDLARRWRGCPERRCRRERRCMAPRMQCAAAPRFPIAHIEERHAWLAQRLREQLLDILLERMLGEEKENVLVTECNAVCSLHLPLEGGGRQPKLWRRLAGGGESRSEHLSTSLRANRSGALAPAR